MKRPFSIGAGGFTVVELLVAMVILLFVALAMMQTALVTTEMNVRNVMRDEGVRIATETLDDLRYEPFDTLKDVYNGSVNTVNRTIRSMKLQYTITNTIIEISSGTSMIDVRVDWTWRGEIYNTSVSTVRGE